MRATREIGPLEEVERNVQERAKHAALDMASPEAAQRLRELVQDEIATWQLDYRRGTRPFDLVDAEVLAERAMRNLVGYGPLGPLLEDDDVWEVMVNAPDDVLTSLGVSH